MTSRFDELLPFYVNGTLPDSDRAWVEDYLREHPSAGAQLRWYESLQTKLREDVPPVSSEVGLERALQRIHREGPAPQRARRPAAPGLGERLREWFAMLTPQAALRPALAAALAVVVVQSGFLFHLAGENESEGSQLRALKATVVDKGPYLKVSFKPDARETDIRLLLVEVNGSLAGGPGQLGDYYLRVPESQLAASGDKLKASTIVDSVAVVDALPARP